MRTVTMDSFTSGCKMKLELFFVIAAVFGMANASGQSRSGSGRIQGVVISESGAPLAGATVTYTRLARIPLGILPPGTASRVPRIAKPRIVGPEVSSFVKTTATGQFDIGSLPEGSYALCVYAPDPQLLDTCKWDGIITVSVREGGTVAGTQIRVRAGGFIRVRIVDPLRLLPLSDAQLVQRLSVGVNTLSGAYHGLNLSKPDGSTIREFRIAVPLNVPLSLWVFSRYLRMSDERNVALRTLGTSTAVMVSEAARSRIFTFSITGALAPEKHTIRAPGERNVAN